jgi:hypothetical protein
VRRAYRNIVLIAAWAFLIWFGFEIYKHPNSTIAALYVFVASTAAVFGWAHIWKEPTEADLGQPRTWADLRTIIVITVACAVAGLFGIWLATVL